MHYRNPVIPGFHPDPTVCRVGEDYYLATSSFAYFPGVPLYHSRNLVDWTPIGHALERDAQLPLTDAWRSDGVYAPTLRHHEGTFYLTTTNTSQGGHFVVTADDPAGEWSDPVWVDAPGIDPDLFWDDGTCYFTYHSGEGAVRQAELDVETGHLGEPQDVWTGFEDEHAEAPHVYERDGTYYLLVAEGGTHTGHVVVAARSDDPTGPFEGCPHNPILTHRAIVSHPIQATGHADLVVTPDGDWWLCCLGIRQTGGFPGWHHLGRETFLAPVEWVDGWPVVNGGKPIDPEMPAERLPGPRPDTDLDPHEVTRTEFDGDELGPEWVYRRNPDRHRYDVGDGVVVLEGGPETLDHYGGVYVGRRQEHFDCRVQARLDFAPAPNEEAGLAVVADERHHYDLGVRHRDGEREAFVRLRIGDATDVIGTTALPSGPVTLEIEADEESYEFGVGAVDREPRAPGTVDGETKTLGTAATRYVSTEVAGGFMGVTVGCWATGNGSESETPARFERFAYEPIE